MIRSAPVAHLLLVLGLTACGGSGDSGSAGSDAASTPSDLTGAMEAASQAMQGMTAAAAAGPASFTPEQVRDRLPQTVTGFPRVDLSVTSGGMMGLTASTIHARYAGEGVLHVEITIVDMSGAPQMVAASAPWTMLTLDRTTESGFERTGQVDGFPSFESQAVTGGIAQSEVAILVGSYLFTLTSRGTDVAGLREIASSLGLSEYAG